MVDWLKECFFPMRYMMGRKYNIVWPFGIGKYVSKYWLNNITTWFNENGVQTWLKNQFKHSIWLSPFVRVCFLFDFGSIFWHDVIEILCQQNTKLNHFKMMSSYSLDNWLTRFCKHFCSPSWFLSEQSIWYRYVSQFINYFSFYMILTCNWLRN